MTGDGAGYDDGVGFHADMERMYAAGWGTWAPGTPAGSLLMG